MDSEWARLAASEEKKAGYGMLKVVQFVESDIYLFIHLVWVFRFHHLGPLQAVLPAC